MPLKKSVSSLKDMCWEVVKDNLHDAGFRNEFKTIPTELRNEILDRLLDDYWIEGTYQETIKKIKRSTKLLEKVFPICKDTIQKLKLSYFPPWGRGKKNLSGHVLKKLVKKNHLIHVNLRGSLCRDSDLQLIGMHCPNLLHLDLTGCRQMTDKGVKLLCTHQTTGKSRNLKIEKLLIQESSITKQGCMIALKNLPFIKKLQCTQWYEICKLLAEEVASSDTLPCYSIENLHLMSIGIKADMHPVEIALNTFPNLRKFLFFCSLSRNIVRDLLPNIGNNNLTHLIVPIGIDDIEIICRRFPLLQKLDISVVSENNRFCYEATSEVETSFKHLRELTLGLDRRGQLRRKHYKMLLANCYELECLRVFENYTLNDNIMFDVLRWNPLRNLREIKLVYSVMTAEPLRKLVEMDNSLALIGIEHCRAITMGAVNEINSKAKNLNLDLVIDKFPQFNAPWTV